MWLVWLFCWSIFFCAVYSLLSKGNSKLQLSTILCSYYLNHKTNGTVLQSLFVTHMVLLSNISKRKAVQSYSSFNVLVRKGKGLLKNLDSLQMCSLNLLLSLRVWCVPFFSSWNKLLCLHLSDAVCTAKRWHSSCLQMYVGFSPSNVQAWS